VPRRSLRHVAKAFLYALISGHLSQANFKNIFRWVGDDLKQWNPFRKENSGHGMPLEKDPSIHAAEESQPPRPRSDLEKGFSCDSRLVASEFSMTRRI
jgi:hypothetical protein